MAQTKIKLRGDKDEAYRAFLDMMVFSLPRPIGDDWKDVANHMLRWLAERGL